LRIDNVRRGQNNFRWKNAKKIQSPIHLIYKNLLDFSC
jgi:hypothetical protein